MNKSTIVDVASKVLKILGKPSTIEEIFTAISDHDLYQFNTPTPEHVLRTTIRRHTKNVARIDASDKIHFELVGDDMYTIVENGTTPKKTAASGMKRIQRASDKEDIIKSLMADQVGIFKEIWRLLLFTAQVGYKNTAREQLKAPDPGKGIDQATFGNSPSWPGVLYLMALVESGRSDCLSGTSDAEAERITIFQEYANGGLSILKDFFSNRTVDLDGMIAFIDSQKEENAEMLDLELTI